VIVVRVVVGRVDPVVVIHVVRCGIVDPVVIVKVVGGRVVAVSRDRGRRGGGCEGADRRRHSDTADAEYAGEGDR
jgi:hypothetical protein